MIESPWDIFQEWRRDAQLNPLFNPDSMILATVGPDLKPSARMVYFNGVRENGFSFFTNYESKKSQQIISNNQGALLFYWPHIKKQIRVEGTISKLTRQTSCDYFSMRQRESQITACVSKQSRPLVGEFAFEEELKVYTEKMNDLAINCPPHWGGYKLVPTLFEFWTSRQHRRHKRVQYEIKNSNWSAVILYP